MMALKTPAVSRPSGGLRPRRGLGRVVCASGATGSGEGGGCRRRVLVRQAPLALLSGRAVSQVLRLEALALALVSAPAGAQTTTPEDSIVYEDTDQGFRISLPAGWRSELGQYTEGTPRLDFKPRDRVDSTRISIAVTPAGKLDEVSMASYAASIGSDGVDSRSWGIKQARAVSGEGKTAAIATLIGSGENDVGRVYTWEWSLDSILPIRSWGANGVSLGANPTARKLKLRNLITVTGIVPEADADGALGQLVKSSVESFRFIP